MSEVGVASTIVVFVALLRGCTGGVEVDDPPPVISEVAVSDITETTAIAAWTTDESATRQVETETLAESSF